MGAAGGNQAAGGAGGASSYEALKKLDQQWLQMRSMTTTTQGTHTHLLAAKASWTKQASQQSLNFLFLFLILVSFFFFFTHVNLSLGKVLTARTDGILDC